MPSLELPPSPASIRCSRVSASGQRKGAAKLEKGIADDIIAL
jgi:hypothetical protein